MCKLWLVSIFIAYLEHALAKLDPSAAHPEARLQYVCDYCQPEQIHIAFGESSSDIVVTWTTFNDTDKSAALYWSEPDGKRNTVAGRSTLFQDGGSERRKMYIHRATLPGLKPNTTYSYVVGSQYGWSERFQFRTRGSGPLRLALYGDMGNENAHALPYLQLEALAGSLDAVLHVGDFAYDMDSRQARVGDQFMRQLQPLAATVPYMVCAGNHEEAYNFSNYRARWSMPGPSEGLYYSWNLGPVHFVSVSSEVYYFPKYGLGQLLRQYEWLEQDLRAANEPDARSVRPWLVLYAHRPMYCSNADDTSLYECEHEYTRTGLPVLGLGLEPLLMKFGVDLVVWAHEHSYERTWPLYSHAVYNGTSQQPYTNPRAPVHVVTGSAGCNEATDNFVEHPAEWSAFRSSDYGYSRMKVFNNTHLYFEQVSVDKAGQVIDSFWLIKDHHGPYEIESPANKC